MEKREIRNPYSSSVARDRYSKSYEDNDETIDSELTVDEDLRQALLFAVGKICREEEASHDVDVEDEDDNDDENEESRVRRSISSLRKSSKEQSPKMGKKAIETLTQMTYHYATRCLGPDLVAFSLHANRKTITADDVKLVARKNPGGLLQLLERFCDADAAQGRRSPLMHDGEGGASGRRKKGKASMTRPLKPADSASDDSDGDDTEDFERMGLTQKRDYAIKRADLSSSSSVDGDDSVCDPIDVDVDGEADKQSISDNDSANVTFGLQVESSSNSDCDRGCTIDDDKDSDTGDQRQQEKPAVPEAPSRSNRYTKPNQEAELGNRKRSKHPKNLKAIYGSDGNDSSDSSGGSKVKRMGNANANYDDKSMSVVDNDCTDTNSDSSDGSNFIGRCSRKMAKRQKGSKLIINNSGSSSYSSDDSEFEITSDTGGNDGNKSKSKSLVDTNSPTSHLATASQQQRPMRKVRTIGSTPNMAIDLADDEDS